MVILVYDIERMDNIKNSSTVKKFHLLSWNKDLCNKIKSNEKKITDMLENINSLGEKNSKKENDIMSLEKTMENTLDHVEKYIKTYSDNIVNKFLKVKNEKYEDPRERGNDLFKLYREMYQDAKDFFSHRDFKYENSSLKTKLHDTFQNYLEYIFDDEDCNDWANVLIPIWSLEKMYNDMETKHNEMNQSYQSLQKKFQYRKKIYDDLNGEIENMKHELEELKNFSSRIKTNI